jgi:acyl carrier protein
VTEDAVIAELRQFVAREILKGKDEGLDATTPLIEWGLIDSVSIVVLSNFVAKRFGVEIPNAEMKPSNLATLTTVAALIARLQSGPTVRA